MSQTPTKKQLTHQRILDAAGQGFRSKGYAGVGVDGIAKTAGATSGAFYAHFGSKDGAFSAALKAGLDEVIKGIAQYRAQYGENWVAAFAKYYLSPAHQKDMACGCAMTTLSPEVTRANAKVQAVYEAGMNTIVDLIADGLAGGSQTDRQGRAWAMLSALIGGLTLARAVHSQAIAERIASSASFTAVQAAGQAVA
jgi:TetR/AcrR family transcriptional regulator, transcriptional repressor for nem operon